MVDALAWLTPSVLWTSPKTRIDEADFTRPWLAEFRSDNFVQEFVDLLASTGDGGPSSLRDRAPLAGQGSAHEPYVLYQPLHGCFYLVVGSLVCRRVGLPDREIPARGQRVSFVVRRLRGGGEDAWIPVGTSGRWTPVADALRFHAGEEQHPLHPAVVGAPVASGTTAHLLSLDEPGVRTLHFGYVPIAPRQTRAQPLNDPVSALAHSSGRKRGDDARLLEFRPRIAGPWADLIDRGSVLSEKMKSEASLYLLLDLRDWLEKWLPQVLRAVVSKQRLTRPAAEALRLAMNGNILKNGAAHRLGDALGELAGYAPLIHGTDIPGPSDGYDVSAVALRGLVHNLGGAGPDDGGLVLAALLENGGADATPEQVPLELAQSIVARPAPGANVDLHVVRLVYEHEPCEPVLSKPSAVLRFAGVYDPDAPARSIRIELPDPAHLRRFHRGVAIEMPPTLRNLLERVTPDLLRGEGLAPDQPSQWDLGMICSFSIQIVTLVAFIVMFIFLILLNIVFWWLPFLKVCFPVPRKSP